MKYKLALLLLLLTFLSGDFTLSRLNLEVDLSVKYIFFILFLGTLLLPEREDNYKFKIRLNKPLIIFLSLMFMYLIISTGSIYYSPNPMKASEKLIDIIFLSFLIIGLVYIVNRMNQKEFISFLSLFFLTVGLIYVIPVIITSFSNLGRGNIALGGSNVTTRILFFAAISAFFKFSITKKTLYLLMIIAFLGGTVLTGSRGGMVGALTSLCMLFLSKRVFKTWRIRKKLTFKAKHIIYLLVGLSSAYLIYDRVMDVFLSRFIRLTFGGGTIYTAGRNVLYEQSINMIKERPFLGHGLNGFDILTGRGYPHNLILELMNDMGVFGLFFFIVAALFSIMLIFKFKYSQVYVFSVLPFYMIVVHMFSGSIYDFRYFFLWIIPLLYYGVGDTVLVQKKIKNINFCSKKPIYQ